MKVHHIGYVVKHIDRAVAEFTALGGGGGADTKTGRSQRRSMIHAEK